MIIFGFRVRGTAIGTGTFFCPQEGGDREYQRQRLRRWFTLFFIPLIPLNVLGEAVHCTSCGGDWDPAVLARPTTADLHGALAGLVTAVAGSLAYHGGPAVFEAATRFVLARGGDLDQLDSHTSVALGTIEERARALHESLATPGMERLVSDAVVVAEADGHLADDDLQVLTAMARGLGMSQAHFEGVLAATRRRRSS